MVSGWIGCGCMLVEVGYFELGSSGMFVVLVVGILLWWGGG